MPRSWTDSARRRRARGGGRRSWGSGSGRGGRGRRPRRRRRAPQRRQCLESEACWSPGSATPSSSTPKYHGSAPCTRPEVGDERVVGVEHELRAGRRARRRPRPSGRRSSRARRSGRAGRGTGWRAAARAGCSSSTTWPSQNSSTSNRPEVAVELAPAAARGVGQRGGDAARHVRPGAVVDEPRAGALEDRGHHRGGRRLAVGGRDHDAAVPSRPASSPIACGSRRMSTLPGSEVPPPRPARRASAPTALRRGRALGASRLSGHQHPQRPGLRRARWPAARRSGRRRRRRRTAGRRGRRPRARGRTSTPGSRTCAPLNTFGSARRNVRFGDVADDHDVEHAVVELGVGGEEHAAAVDAGVRAATRVQPVNERGSPSITSSPARGPPGAHRAQRRVGVDELAELARGAWRWRVAWRRSRSPSCDPDEGPAADVADVERCRAPRGDHVAGRLGVGGRCPSTRAKSLPRPPGSTASTPSGCRAARRRRAPTSPSPPIAAATSPAVDRRARELAGVLDRVRALERNASPCAAQRAPRRRAAPSRRGRRRRSG